MLTQLSNISVQEPQTVSRQIHNVVEFDGSNIKITTLLIVPNPPESTPVSQIDTITISAGILDDIYSISIASDGTTDYADTLQISGDTADSIAARLVAEMNNNSAKIFAEATGGTITVVANTPGDAVVYSVASSSTPGNLVVANIIPASGTIVKRKIHETLISNTANNANFGQNITFRRLDGDTEVGRSTSASNHTISIPQLITNALA